MLMTFYYDRWQCSCTPAQSEIDVARLGGEALCGHVNVLTRQHSWARGVRTLRAPLFERRYVRPLGGAFRCVPEFVSCVLELAQGIVTGRPRRQAREAERVEPGLTAESCRVRPLAGSMITSSETSSSCAIPTAASGQLLVRPKALLLHPWPVVRW